jgi:hypothetical protein
MVLQTFADIGGNSCICPCLCFIQKNVNVIHICLLTMQDTIVPNKRIRLAKL